MAFVRLRPGAARVALGAGVWETGYLATQDLDATVQSVQGLWDNREQALAVLESGGIGGACVLTVGSAAYMVLTRERRELMREWVVPLHEALHRPLGLAEQTDPRRYLHIPKNFSDDDAETRIDLPKHLDFSRDVVADRVTQKLALEGVTFDWHPEGSKPYVRVKKTRKPPAKALQQERQLLNVVTGVHDQENVKVRGLPTDGAATRRSARGARCRGWILPVGVLPAALS